MIEELCDPERILHIDSKVLRDAEAAEDVEMPEEKSADDDEDAEPSVPKLTKKQQAQLLRLTVDSVGQPGKPGAMIQNVISVGMLSEGWDAKTVTHIMGLRAFSSQLLCEQVVGRGLRRTSYELINDRFEPEYVNILGVPFTFIPHEDPGEIKPRPPKPTTRVESMKDRMALDIDWPNVIRIDREYCPQLEIDFKKMKPLILDAYKTVQQAGLAPMVAGKPNLDQITEVDLEALAKKFRRQRVVFEAVRDLFDQLTPDWKGAKESLIGQLVALAERYLDSGLVQVDPPLFYQDPLRQRIIYTLNLRKIVRHLYGEIQCANTQQIAAVLDPRNPIRRASDMSPWHTTRPCFKTAKGIINVVVLDSTWEASEAYHLDHSAKVNAWVKNDHLGFEIFYQLDGVIRRYRPDYLVTLSNGERLIVEVKGVVTDEVIAKQQAAEQWVEAVNADGRFGVWRYARCDKPQAVLDVL